MYGSRRTDIDDFLDNIEVDIEILMSRIDAMNSLHEPLQEDSVLSVVSQLTETEAGAVRFRRRKGQEFKVRT